MCIWIFELNIPRGIRILLHTLQNKLSVLAKRKTFRTITKVSMKNKASNNVIDLPTFSDLQQTVLTTTRSSTTTS